MTRLSKVRSIVNALGRQGRGWRKAAMLASLAPAAIGLLWTASVASAQEGDPPDQPAARKESADGRAETRPGKAGKYTASALLRISLQENRIIESTPAEKFDRDRFEIFKNTQRQLVMSRLVLTAALKNPEVAKLASVRDATKAGDVVNWLAARLRVGSPGNAEIMQVSVTGDDGNEAAALANAVVGAYLNEVVNAETEQKRRRLSQVEIVLSDREAELYAKREELKKLADTFGTSETEAMSVEQKLAMEDWHMAQNDLAQYRMEMRRAKVELAVAKTLLKDAEGRTGNGAEAAREGLRANVRRKEIEVLAMSEEHEAIVRQVQEMRNLVSKLGRTSVQIEMLRAGIKNLDNVVKSLATESEKVRLECRTPPRVTLVQPAAPPAAPDR
jgi:hypothetical protein